MAFPMQKAVLVLNASFEPISICGARRALALVVKDKAVIQEDHGVEVYQGIMFPSVLRLKEFTYVPARVQILTRKNILIRDRYRCQYCQKSLKAADLTLDHIIPKSKGGKDSFENLVACCQGCNRKKADKSLEECGFTLARKPRPVTIHTSRSILRSLGQEDVLWKKYLYYDNEGSQATVARPS